MKTHFDIEKLVAKNSITNELDYERALIADRQLRLLSKDSVHFKNLRSKLRDLIEAYEDKEWTDVDLITEQKLLESDKYERLAEIERQFIDKRRLEIRSKLKQLELTQENLATLLGHKSKTHMSELMNGIVPFTLKDLVIINRLLKIDLNILIPNFLSHDEQVRVKNAVIALNKPAIKLRSDDLVLV